MPVCGCGQQLGGAEPILNGGTSDDLGIIVTGDALNPTVIAADAVAWRPIFLGTNPNQFQMVNFTLGNGTYSARYLRVGFAVDLIMSFRFGTTSTFAAAEFQINVPWDPSLGNNSIITNAEGLGWWSVFDDSSGNFYRGGVIVNGAGNLAFRYGDDLSGSNTTLRQPSVVTFAADDELSFLIRFRAAAN